MPLLEGLSPFWAQEYVGADLLIDILKEETELKDVRVGVLDAGFSAPNLLGKFDYSPDIGVHPLFEKAHGTLVSNLINSPSPFGASPFARLSAIRSVMELNEAEFVRWKLDEAFLGIEQARPAVTNASLRLRGLVTNCQTFLNANQLEALEVGNCIDSPQKTLALLQSLSQSTILVIASGNAFQLEPQSIEPVGVDAVFVGSMSPVGWVSLFSNENKDVVVLAPSDHYLMSYGAGTATKFSHTSGAAPQVTGALANVLAVLPDLTIHEARTLLQKTAVPIGTSNQTPKLNGNGMLNSLKLFEVARRIRLKASKRTRSELLNDPLTYDFSVESKALYLLAQPNLQSSDCELTRLGLRQLRRSFLLSPSKLVADSLAEIYERQGLFYNAEYYRNFSRAHLELSIDQGLNSLPDRYLNLFFGNLEKLRAAALRMKQAI